LFENIFYKLLLFYLSINKILKEHNDRLNNHKKIKIGKKIVHKNQMFHQDK